MDMRRLRAAADDVVLYRKKVRTAEAVLKRRRGEMDRAVQSFCDAGGTIADLARLLGVSRSAAQRAVERARRA